MQALHHLILGLSTGDTIHLLHVVPEPSMIHVWPGMYVPPDDNAEQEEVRQSCCNAQGFNPQVSSADIYCMRSIPQRILLKICAMCIRWMMQLV